MSVQPQHRPGGMIPAGSLRALRTGAICAGLVLVPLALIVVMLRSGLAGAVGPAGRSPAPASSSDGSTRLLVALPVILCVCWICGRVFGRLAQPPVIGEILAGVILGPSVLGIVWPRAFGALLPAGTVSMLYALAQFGLIFFMFLVGYELNLAAVRQRGNAAAVISYVSIAVPFLCGILLAFMLYKPLSSHRISFLAFALFLGISMSITAFPVLARILSDRRMTETPLGVLSLTCAAANDVTAWCLLALVVAIVRSAALGSAAITTLLTLGFFALMVFVVRPVLRRCLATDRRLTESGVLAAVLAGAMLSALATDAIGIQPIFGAFLFGAILPRGCLRIDQAAGQLRGITVTLLLPLFFLYTGLHTRFGLLGTNTRLWVWCWIITATAAAAKAAGSSIAGRLAGVKWQESVSLGVLMNCRGLTELVVLSIGMSMKVISPTLFTMLVFMSLVSTTMTAPSLDMVRRAGRRRARNRDPRRQPGHCGGGPDNRVPASMSRVAG
jgi:Kef-type K+ transport system membrane component KefB